MSFGLRAKMLSILLDSLPTDVSLPAPATQALSSLSMVTASSPISPSPGPRKSRASPAIPPAKFSCARQILARFSRSAPNTKPKARSNPALSTRNYSRSGAASSGGVLSRLPPPSLQPIRMNHAWNSLYAREIRRTPAASGPAGTAPIRNRAVPWKRHPRASFSGKPSSTMDTRGTAWIGSAWRICLGTSRQSSTESQCRIPARGPRAWSACHRASRQP